MKHFPSSWETFFGQVALWGGLSVAARRAFLDGLRPGLSLAAAPGSPAVDELRGAGFLSDSQGSTAVRIDEALVGFHQMMKALEAHPLFVGPVGPDQPALCSYLAEHYSQKERSALHESIALLPNDLPRVARLVSSVEWLEEFLAREKSEPARDLVRFFMEQRDRVPVRDLEEYFPSLGRVAIGAALSACLRRAVVFLGLRGEDLEPLVGIWPAAARRLHRLAVVLAPRPVAAAHAFHHPWLVEDMTTVLLAARTEPIRVRRGDERPFSRFVEDTAARLLSFPAWLETFTAVTLETRIDLALRGLRVAGFLGPSAQAEATVSLRPRTGWQEWALAPLADRVRTLAQSLSQGGRGPDGIFDLLDEGRGPDEEAPPAGMLRTVLQAFSSVPTASFIRFTDFAEYQAAIGGPSGATAGSRPRGARARPIFSPAPPGANRRGSPGARTSPRRGHGSPVDREPPEDSLPVVSTDEALEELWKFVLHRVLARGILGLGGSRGGRDRRRAALLPSHRDGQAPSFPACRTGAWPRGPAIRGNARLCRHCRAAHLRDRVPVAVPRGRGRGGQVRRARGKGGRPALPVDQAVHPAGGRLRPGQPSRPSSPGAVLPQPCPAQRGARGARMGRCRDRGRIPAPHGGARALTARPPLHSVRKA